MKWTLLLLLCLSLVSCQLEENIEGEVNEGENDITEELPIESQTLYEQVSCGLKSVYGEEHLPLKRSRTLNFIVERLAQNFQSYGLETKIEKAHFHPL